MLIRSPKKQVKTHHISTDFGWGFLFGTAAMIIARSQGGWLFSLAVGGVTSMVSFTTSFLRSRRLAIGSVAALNNQMKSTPNPIQQHNPSQQPDSSLQHVQNQQNNPSQSSSPKISAVRKEHLSLINPGQVNDNDYFYIGFCVKRGFAEWLEGKLIGKSPLKHSSIIFVPMHIMYSLKRISEDKQDEFLTQERGIVILGRQSTIFREENTASFWRSTKHEIVNTEIDNEGKYSFFANAPFEPMMSEVLLSGKEIKAIIKQVDEVICKGNGQLCDMINSNCYSASVCMLAVAIDQLHSRYHDNMHKIHGNDELDLHPQASMKTYQQIKSLSMLMLDVITHNFGQGVLNNPAVVQQVNKALEIASEFDHDKSSKLIQYNLTDPDHRGNNFKYV